MRRRPAVCIAVALATAALLPVGLALGGDPPTGDSPTSTAPKLKEGLWEIRGRSTQNPSNKRTDFSYRLCRNHAYDAQAEQQLKQVEGCDTVLKDLGGGKLAASSTCTASGITIVSNGLTVYRSDEALHAESRATYTPAYAGRTDESVVEDQRYVGKCPDGIKPGDRITAQGAVIHPD